MINICMVAKDRPELTNQCFKSLVRTTKANDVRITIVDDGSTDPFPPWWYRQENLQIVRNKPSMGVAPAKNLCVAASEIKWGRGDYLYMSDNDMYFKAGWLETLERVYEVTENTKFLVMGGYNNPFQGPVDDKIYAGGRYLNAPGPVAQYQWSEYLALGGASWFMSWDVWDTYGPLDFNATGVRMSEDVAFGNRIREDGFKLGAVVPHVVLDCGKTDTNGNPVPYADHMHEEEGVLVL